MFACLFVHVETYDLFDLRITHTQPTLLGRQLGLKNRWTLHQFDGKYGGWKVNGKYRGSDEIEINDKVEVVAMDPNTNIKISLAPSWRGDISSIVFAPELGYHGYTEFLPERVKPALKAVEAA
jgi:hypothetical protein